MGTTGEVISAYNNSPQIRPNIVTREGKPITSVKPSPYGAGETLFKPEGGFCLDISLSAQRVPGTDVVVRVRNIAGVIVNHFNSCLDNFNDVTAPEPGFILEIPKCSLPPGPYSIDVELWENGRRSDQINEACQINVADGIFDGRPAKASGDNASTLTPYRWSIKK